MLGKLKHNLLLDSKIAVGVVVAILFVLGVLQVAQGFIDTHNYRDQFTKIIKEATGRNITIKGKVSFTLLPTPTIYIPGVELHDTESKNPIPSITVDMIKLDVPLAAAFSDRPSISGITLQRPSLEVERAEDNLIHWDWLNAGLIKALAGVNNAAPPALNISEGKIIYHDNRTGKEVTAENLNATITSGNHLGAKGSFITYGHSLEFSFNTDAIPAANATIPFTAELQADAHNTLHWQGSLDLQGDAPKIKGKFDLALQNVMDWTNAKPVERKQPFAIITNQFTRKTEEVKTLVPLKLTGDWSQDGLAIGINNMQLQGLNSTGTGKISLAWKSWQPFVTCEMGFKSLDYNSWQTFLSAAFKTASSDYANGDEQSGNPLPKDTQAAVTINADQVNIGAQVWKKVALSASLADRAVTVNRLSLELPGESALTLFGVISQAATNGMRFEGNIETSGKSLRQALAAFDESAADLPEIAFGAFHVRSNIFVSPEQVRLSEADVKLNDLVLNGGLVAYFDAHPRVEADVKLKDINFDYFRDIWRAKQKTSGQKDVSPKFDRGITFSWLNKLQTSIDFKVNVDKYTFLERKGNNASFRIFAKDGEIGLYDIHLNYPDEVMEGSFTLNVKSQQPLISLILNANAIDLGYFVGTPPDTAPPATPPAPEQPKKDATAVPDKKVWSEALIDTDWMDGYSGAFDISINKLTYGKTTVNRVKLQAKLDNKVLSFQNFTFDYWEGRCSILGSMYGGDVPGLSISFMLYDVEMNDMLKDLIDRDNITGKISASGTLTTSGVNMLSWVSQSDVKLVLAGRGVNVNGFNLQGVTDVVAVSRTAADVFNNVNAALVNGSTGFTIDGNINIKSGIMRTPGIRVQSGSIIGDLTGEIQLVPWTMDLSTTFQFPVMVSETTPTMTVQLSGPLNAPVLKTDTSSLEAYVAKRIISR